jgi:DmsE family decaheme c-type cytochrome
MQSPRYYRRAVLAMAMLIALVGLIGAARTTAAKKPENPAAKALKAAATQNPEDFVGEEMCLTCHEDKGYKGTGHALKSNANTPAAKQGCESCHGAGKAHVEADGDKTKIARLQSLSASEASDACTSCHTKSAHAMWDGSQHDQRNVGCLTCHSVHDSKGPSQIKAANEQELCATCHRNVVNKLNRTSHMPVREGKMACSSCHNPHGTVNQRLLKTGTTLNESCISCHAEKRGPVLWEHAPVVDSCVNCHDPHGSNNERMLSAKQPYICQRCHVTSRHPPTVYEGYLLKNSQNANKIFGRACVSCHQQVHGSNAPSGKAFLR